MRIVKVVVIVSAIVLLAGVTFPLSARASAIKTPPAAGGEGLALVKNGQNPIPIVVFKNAPPLTRLAADELAYYIEKTSGAKPEILEGTPDPLPEHAIWVGYQPVLKKLFPKVDFDFKHPGQRLFAVLTKLGNLYVE